LGGFFVVFAEVAGSVKKLFRDDWRAKAHILEIVEHGLAARTGCFGSLVNSVIKCFVCRFQAGISTSEQSTHVRRDERIRQSVECALTLHIAQVEGTGRVEIYDTAVIGDRTDA